MLKRTVQRSIASVLVLAGVAILCHYVWLERSAHGGPAQPPEAVVIAANTEYVGICAIVVARQEGYFAEEGIAATILPRNSGKSALDAVLQGQAQLGTVADLPVMFAVMKQIPLSIVATFSRANRDHGIVGRRDRGIGLPASLKGKRIGVTMGTSGHFVLSAFLNRQHLAAAQVTMVNLQPDEFLGALTSGKVDAISGWEPHLNALATQLGGNAAVFYSTDIYEIPYNLAGTRAYVATHTATLQKVLRALIRGTRVCNEAPETARRAMATVMNGKVDDWAALWPGYRFGVGLDQGLVLALEDETRWAIANQLTAGNAMPNYLNTIDLRALDAVAPAAVTVIH